MAFERVSDIKAEKVKRLRTGFQELDWLYGMTRFSDRIDWGMPKGKISLWSGESGTGKSRAAIALAKRLGRKTRVLYFQNEVDLGTFAGWANSGQKSPGLYCSNSVDIRSQVEDIYRLRPSVVIVDSINQVEEYGSGCKRDIKNIIEGFKSKDEFGNDCRVEGYRDLVKKWGTHIILIAQLNQDGTVKGSTTLTHLVDITFDIVNAAHFGDNFFSIKVGPKHRYGRTGEDFKTIWLHGAEGVCSVGNLREEDSLWCDTHHIPVRDTFKEQPQKQLQEQPQNLALVPCSKNEFKKIQVITKKVIKDFNKKYPEFKKKKVKKINCNKRESLTRRLINGALIRWSLKRMFGSRKQDPNSFM